MTHHTYIQIVQTTSPIMSWWNSFEELQDLHQYAYNPSQVDDCKLWNVQTQTRLTNNYINWNSHNYLTQTYVQSTHQMLWILTRQTTLEEL
uniref:Uncharacterized protein n=1 Tax=Trichobilharzia regenti TaxID=157069 RepID=A0AA85IX35_TRIRE|nr:unnamed protein product [Trichobilharzia regenti]